MIDKSTIDELRRKLQPFIGLSSFQIDAPADDLLEAIDAAERAQRLEAVLRRMVEEWRACAFRAQQRANLGHYPEGNCATESVYNTAADELENALKDQP